jgi:hypothetical protein
MTSQSSLRIGNTEREAVAAELREHYAHGRLSMEEFEQRLDATFAAKTQGDLTAVTADLPHVRPQPAPLPASRATGGAAASYQSGSGWSGSHKRGYSGRGYATFATLMAALASLLIVYDGMAALRLPGFGRLGLLVAIFTIIRGLLRRVFGGGRGRCGRRW